MQLSSIPACAFMVVGLIGVGCSPSDSRVITGTTMGTYFRVESNCGGALEEQRTMAELERLTLIFSTYRNDSQITEFNRSQSGAWVAVDQDFVKVARFAHRVTVASRGAFNPTVAPWVERWGFGAADYDEPPSSDEIEAIRSAVGMHLIELRNMPPGIRKNQDGVRLDFSGIAKGFAVDRLAELHESGDCENYLVDIGGDMRAKGLNAKNRLWRVGIENPLHPEQMVGYIELSEGAIATSGTYRNVREVGGERLSHLINPNTGLPVEHDLIAASVFAKNAMSADAWVTALSVMGIENSIELIQQWNLSALLMERTSDRDIELHRFGVFASDFKSL